MAAVVVNAHFEALRILRLFPIMNPPIFPLPSWERARVRG
jgi:hypothetical protein